MERIDVLVPGARVKFEDWIKNRGGVQVWENVNLSTPRAGQWFYASFNKWPANPNSSLITILKRRSLKCQYLNRTGEL